MAIQAIDRLQIASFAETEFPYTDLTIEGALDNHLHKYIHRPGGELESLGRRVYEYKFKVAAHTTYKRFPDLYPTRLALLLAACESGATYTLEVPGVGPIQAKAVKWTRNIRAAIRSGESVEFSFMEDDSALFTALNLLGLSVNTMSDKSAIFASTAQAIGVSPTIISKMTSSVDAALDSLNEVVDAFQFVAIPISPVIIQCQTLDNSAPYQDPRNADAIDALHDLWGAALSIQANALQQDAPLETYIVERDMTITEVSLAVYGDGTHISEFLRLNTISNAMRLKPGTFLKHYAIGG